MDASLPSMSENDVELLYCLIERLLILLKVTQPDISTCISYVIAKIESSTKYHKNKQLNVDILFVKKIELFIVAIRG